jgi:hypothetical protein
MREIFRKILNIILQLFYLFNDFKELNHSYYGNIKMAGSHFKVKDCNSYGANNRLDLITFIHDLEKKKVIWDVGAYVGYFFILVAKMRHKMLDFEPNQLKTSYLNKY